MRLPKLITSVHNSWVKDTIQLLEKSRVRSKRGVFAVEGIFEIAVAIKGGYRLDTLVKSEDGSSWNDLMECFVADFDSVDCVEVSDQIWQKLVVRAKGNNALGLFATGKDMEEKEWNPKTGEIWLAVESVEKPGNLGAILRSADGAGISGVVLVDAVVDVFHPQVIRNSLGGVFTVPVFYITKEEFWQKIKETGMPLFTTFMDNSLPSWDAKLGAGSVLLVGTEHEGVSDFWKGKAQNINIPMYGVVDSLNVSVAAALLMYEAKRQQIAG